MNPILEGLIKAFELLLSFDQEVYGIMFLSLRVSLTAVLLGAVLAIPLGATIGLREFTGKKLLVNLINTLMGLPPVVVGLLLFLLLISEGPLGSLNLLFTPTAMIIAQFIMAVPILAGITISAVSSVDKTIKDTALSMGATKWQLVWTVLSEARTGLLTAIITAFGAVISEVGAIMLVGGSIRFYTMTLTTAIVLETSQAYFDVAIALGIILLLLSFVVNLMLTHLQFREGK